MSKPDKREKNLQLLLEQFFIGYSMSEAETIATYAYLFDGHSIPPFFKDSDLYETLDYLQEIVQNEGLTNIEQLLDHFAAKKARTRFFLNKLIHETCEKPQTGPIHTPAGNTRTMEWKWSERWCKPLNTIQTSFKRKPRSNWKYRFFKDAGGRWHWKRLLVSERCKEEDYGEYYNFCLKPLSLSYLLEFAWEKEKQLLCILDIEEVEKFSFIQLSASKRIDNTYYNIMESVREEKPIWGTQFKVAIFAWIFGHDQLPAFYEQGLYLKKWVVLKCPEKHAWITSDRPGFILRKDQSATSHYSFHSADRLSESGPEAILYFPLSKDYCLSIQPDENRTGKLSDSDTPIYFMDSCEHEVKMVNNLTISTSKALVIASEKRFLEECRSV